MIEQLEQELREFFAEDAEQAPAAVALADKARQRVQESRRTRLRWGARGLSSLRRWLPFPSWPWAL